MASYGFREETTLAQKAKDGFDCQLAAAQNVPTNTQIGTAPTYTTPTYTTPLYTTCSGYSCYTTGGQTTGGQTYGGQVYSYDANQQLRATYFDRCMIEKGYRPVPLPVCSQGSVPGHMKPLLSGKLRPPREDACIVPMSNGASNVVYRPELIK